MGLRAWRLLPPTVRREALFSAMAALAPRPDQPPPPAALPLTVAGYFRADSGLGEGARRLADMLDPDGAAVARADLTAALRQGPPGPLPVAPAGTGTLVVHVNGPMLPWALRALGRPAIRGKRILAYWAWELPVLAPDWQRGFRFAHGVLVPSRFVAEAVRAAGALPVAILPHPLPRGTPARLGRSDFGLPAEAFVSLAVFNAASSVERKNPLAAVRAHQRAFGDRPDRLLLLKTYHTGMGGPAWREVVDAAAASGNIRILDQAMPADAVWALTRCCDALLSLHRAEGFGLALAEAMWLGVPVIATGWSGNMDFMDAGSAMLVPWRLVPAADARAIYAVPGARWADPDIDAAAAALRALADDPALRARLGAAGRARVAPLAPEACAALVRAAILPAAGPA
jgi:glycosyltransferase involved in cell wall biosynthesis